MTRDAAEIARLSAEAMWAADRAGQALGIEVLETSPGRARVAMTVAERMINGHATCHGAFIFTLADTAFALASSSHGRRVAVQHCSVTFLTPGRLGMRLVAEARERHRAGRNGIYDVAVRDAADGTVIAEFRGHARITAGSRPDEDETHRR